MKKIFYIFLTILAAVFVFLAIVFLFSQNKSKGALQVTSTPNSKVYLDDKEIGVTPLCKCDLKGMITEGNYTIKLIPTEGNKDPFEQKITISKNALTVVDRNFAEKGLDSASIISLNQIQDSNDVQISVETFPVGVQVYLDNNLQGQSPILLKGIKESDHELKVIKDGYKEKIVRIKTIKGFKLDTVILLGLDPSIASLSSQIPIILQASTTANLNKPKITILDTPTGFLRVRADASVISAELAQAKPGDVYEYVGEKNGWYEIKLTNGKLGWVSSQYSSKSD